jgi:hypothetical protein
MAVCYGSLGLLVVVANVLSLLVLPLHSAQAAKLVVLGDSLSDTGRAYEACNHVSPLSPPYFKGREGKNDRMKADSWFEEAGKLPTGSNIYIMLTQHVPSGLPAVSFNLGRFVVAMKLHYR